MSELDLGDNDAARTWVEQEAVWLAPAFPKRIDENDPRS